MERTIKLRRMGGSLGSTFPKGIMDRLKLEDGDEMFVLEDERGMYLTPFDPKFDKVMEAYEDLSRRYRNTLSELAK